MSSADDARRFSALIEGIYDSVIDPAGWSEVGRMLADYLGGHQCILMLSPVMTRAERGEHLIVPYNIDPEIMLRFAHIGLEDDIWHLGQRQLPAGTPCLSDQFIPLGEYRNKPFFQEICRPADVAHMVGAVTENAPNQLSLFACHCSARAGPFGQDDLAKADLIAEHFGAAERLAHRLGRLDQKARAVLHVLERSDYGVFLTNEYGSLIWANGLAECIFREDDGLFVSAGEVAAARSSETEQLRQLIASAIAVTLGHANAKTGSVMGVSRPSGGLNYQLSICPLSLRSEAQVGGRVPACVAFILDPEAPPRLSEEGLARLYGLTPAEISLTRAMFEGRSVTEAAEYLRISPLTARTHLKRIFRKCRVNSQAALMRRFALSLARS